MARDREPHNPGAHDHYVVVGGVGGRSTGGLDLGFGPERAEPALATAPWAEDAEALGVARGRRSGGGEARGARVPSGSERDGGIHWKRRRAGGRRICKFLVCRVDGGGSD